MYKRIVCDSCAAEFEIESVDEEYPILFCPSCGHELDNEEEEVETDE